MNPMLHMYVHKFHVCYLLDGFNFGEWTTILYLSSLDKKHKIWKMNTIFDINKFV